MKQEQQLNQGHAEVALLNEVKAKLKELGQLGYQPGRLHRAIAEKGIHEAVADVVLNDGEGFKRCLIMGRLDCTMEWVVLAPQRMWEFSPRVREAAYCRLEAALRLLSVHRLRAMTPTQETPVAPRRKTARKR